LRLALPRLRQRFAPALRRARATRLALALSLALAGMLAASPCRAHNPGYSTLAVEMRPAGLEASVTLHPGDIAYELGLAASDSLMHARFLGGETPQLAELIRGRIGFEADGRPLALAFEGVAPDPDRRGLTLRFGSPWARVPGALGVTAHLVPLNPNHQTFLNVYENGRILREDVLTDERRSTVVYTRGGAGLAAVAAAFVPAGIHHIFTGPDHILFVIGLLLLGGSLGRLLKIVTGFTLAHSVTLALAALGLVNPPSRVIEPAIALSIVLIGIENLRWRPGAADRRAWIAFGFGFVHGFGFAGVLRETGLPREAMAAALAFFNVGVEIGQACIVLGVVPLLALARARAPRFAPSMAATGSWGVTAAGAFWLVQRVLGAG
jgi:hypothetical protein